MKDLLIRTDVSQAVHPMTGNDATKGSTEMYHNILCNPSRFHSFLYFLYHHQERFLFPHLYSFHKLLPLGREKRKKKKRKKLAFTLLSHCTGIKSLNIYALHCHVLGGRGNITGRGHYSIMQRTRQQAKWRHYRANQPHAEQISPSIAE